MEFNSLIEQLNQNKPLIALVYIFSSFVIAFIVDQIFIRVFRAIVKKSQTTLDDEIIEVLHKP